MPKVPEWSVLTETWFNYQTFIQKLVERMRKYTCRGIEILDPPEGGLACPDLVMIHEISPLNGVNEGSCWPGVADDAWKAARTEQAPLRA